MPKSSKKSTTMLLVVEALLRVIRPTASSIDLHGDVKNKISGAGFKSKPSLANWFVARTIGLEVGGLCVNGVRFRFDDVPPPPTINSH